MRFSIVRRLKDAEEALDREILRASTDLAGESRPRHLLLALHHARITRHGRWDSFIRVARPLLEAREGIAAARRGEQETLRGEMLAGIRKVASSRGKPRQ